MQGVHGILYPLNGVYMDGKKQTCQLDACTTRMIICTNTLYIHYALYGVLPLQPRSLWKSMQSQLRSSPLTQTIPLRPLPHNFPLDLPRRTLRHLINKHHPARQPLIFRHLPFHPPHYLLLTNSGIIFIETLRHNVSAGPFLAVEGIGNGYDAGVGNGGVGEEEGFEFGGGDLEAGDFD